MEIIWDIKSVIENLSKSEVIGRGGYEKNEWPRRTDKNNNKTKILQSMVCVLQLILFLSIHLLWRVISNTYGSLCWCQIYCVYAYIAYNINHTSLNQRLPIERHSAYKHRAFRINGTSLGVIGFRLSISYMRVIKEKSPEPFSSA